MPICVQILDMFLCWQVTIPPEQVERGQWSMPAAEGAALLRLLVLYRLPAAT